MASIMAVDPGKVTGVAILNTRKPGIETFELAGRYVVADFVQGNAPSEMVCEQFVISERTIRTAQDVNALRIIGWLDIWTHQHAIPFDLQTAAQAKKFASDDKLKALGWYTATHDGHANDAARHLLVYLHRKHSDFFRTYLLPTLMETL
jgi:hypothetical protein